MAIASRRHDKLFKQAVIQAVAMLLVRTLLDRSPIEGIGLFAVEPIRRGALVWQFVPTVDLVLRPQDLAALSPAAREQIERYAYLDRRTGELILCGDDARFFNHSDHPNVVDDPHDPRRCFAARDIAAGEELVCDYFEFDASAAGKLPASTPCRRRAIRHELMTK